MSKVRNEARAPYLVSVEPSDDDKTITAALAILERRLSSRRDGGGYQFERPEEAMVYCRLKFAAAERELFSVLFLDTRHRLIRCETLSAGSIDSATVHPREVVKAALQHNAAAVVFTHNHPSGNPEPSAADAAITRRLVDALALVDVRVLDHLVVGEHSAVSMAALGMM